MMGQDMTQGITLTDVEMESFSISWHAAASILARIAERLDVQDAVLASECRCLSAVFTDVGIVAGLSSLPLGASAARTAARDVLRALPGGRDKRELPLELVEPGALPSDLLDETRDDRLI